MGLEFMKNNFMTFNLKYDFTDDKENRWEDRAKRIVTVIKENNPICFGTQEGLIHMLKDINELLEEYSWFGEGREGNEEGEFNAIFYKREALELIENGQFWLSETPNIKGSISWKSGCKRICTWGVFKEKQYGNIFRIYNTHLDNASDLAREEGIKVILDFAKEKYDKDKLPFIITGDFNSYMEENLFKIIRSYNNENFNIKNSYNEVSHNIKGTFHDFKGGYSGGIIDYILFSKEISCNKINIDDRLINGGYPSDHYAVTANLNIEN